MQLDAVIVESASRSSPSSLPTELQDLIETMGSFHICQKVNLADLLIPTFMNDYVRRGKGTFGRSSPKARADSTKSTGSLIALSVRADEGDDVVCIDGRGL